MSLMLRARPIDSKACTATRVSGGVMGAGSKPRFGDGGRWRRRERNAVSPSTARCMAELKSDDAVASN